MNSPLTERRIERLKILQATCVALAGDPDPEEIAVARTRAERWWNEIMDGRETPVALLLIIAWWVGAIRESLEEHS